MNRIAISLFLITISFTVFSHNVPEWLKKCSGEQNSLKRLACFDEMSQKPTSVSEKPTTAKKITPTLVTLPKQPTRPSDRFGLEHKPKLDELKEKIVANVLSIKKDLYKKHIITLVNGHVWKQSGNTSLKISAGDSVIVTRGSLGSFFMKKEGVNKRIRVKRLK